MPTLPSSTRCRTCTPAGTEEGPVKVDSRIATVGSLLWFALCLIMAVLERNPWKIDQWLFC